jgi:hypothetical protein
VRGIRTGLALTAATLFAVASAALPGVASATSSAVAGSAAVIPAADPTPAAPKKLFTIRDERIKESSGLAKSQKHQNLWWTANDSGSSAKVFGIDATGKVKVTLGFKADVKDVEAVGVDGDGTIYIADIGDNKANRDMIEIYTIPEPDSLEDVDSVSYHRYDFKYPDGAHDAETLLIEPGTNQLFIVTKVLKGTGAIYAAPPAPSRQGTNELTELTTAPSGVITDGTFLPDGQRVVLRTYVDVATIQWGETPTVIARGAVPFGQGETVALGPTDNTVLVGNEGANSAVYQVQIPAKQAASQPPASATATPKPTTGAEAGSDNSSGKSHNLRWILVGAAVFAFIITILTFPPGRRERLDRMAENARLTGQAPPTSHGRHHG